MRRVIQFLSGSAGLVFFILFFAGEVRANVIIISIDALRPDHLSCYGYPRQTSPNIDKIAEHGVIFEDATTLIPLTNPSMSSLLTSRTPAELKVNRNGIPLRAGTETLANILRGHGYNTTAIVGSWALFSTRSGLYHGFDYYNDRGMAVFVDEEASVITKRALKLIDSGRLKEPFLLWLHYADPHQPHKLEKGFNFPREQYAEGHQGNVISNYDSEVAYADHWVGVLLDNLQNKGYLEHSLIVILADHGESLGEKNYYGHGRRLDNPVLHIPLIISGNSIPEGKKYSHPVQMLDIAPTIMSYLGLTEKPDMKGRNLLPLLSKDTPADPVPFYFETYSTAVPDVPGFKYLGRKSLPTSIGMRVGNTKLIYHRKDKTWEMYNLDEDPHEQNNLFDPDDPNFRMLAKQLWDWYQERNEKKKTMDR